MSRRRQPSTATLRRGYWMQFWAGLYAVGRVYPQPRLTAVTVLLVVVLAALILETTPTTGGWSQ